MFLRLARAFESEWFGFLLENARRRKENFALLYLFCFLPLCSDEPPCPVMTLTDVVPRYSNPPDCHRSLVVH